MVANPPPAINPSSFPSHLVIEHLQLLVVLLQLRQLGQQLTSEMQVDQAGRAELGHPRFLWTQAVEGLCKGPEQREDTETLWVKKVFT